MLPKNRRITRQQGLSLGRYKAHASKLLKLREFEGKNRAAIVIPKRVESRSTARNRLKRAISAVIEKIDFPSKDIIVFVEPAAKRVSLPELAQELKNILSKI